MPRKLLVLLLFALLSPGLRAQEDAAAETPGFRQAAASAHKRLEKSLAELSALRTRAEEETVSLNKRLSALEEELTAARLEYQDVTRLLDSRTLDLTNLRSEIEARKAEAAYVSNLFSEYVRNFESRLHIAELQRYEKPLEAAKLAPENDNLTQEEIYEAQTSLIGVSLERLEDLLGGTRFEGSAVDDEGRLRTGTFLLLGPAALFQSKSVGLVGTVEQRINSLEPGVAPYTDPAMIQAAGALIEQGAGNFPLDPTFGNAQKIAQTNDTFIEHVKKGGVVMWPIFILAGLAAVVALLKWLGMLLIRKPSRKRQREMLEAVARGDREAAAQAASAMRGPTARMLQTGVEHMREPVELIEEVMYEHILATRLKLNRFLPFIAICASSAPLLGLLGTVTGIITTFKLITVFGSGDVKMLSGGISEALITTKFGLIVAIPSLLIHAFLSRKAKGFIDQMEKSAIALINQISKSASHTWGGFSGDGASARREERPSLRRGPETPAGALANREARRPRAQTHQSREIVPDGGPRPGGEGRFDLNPEGTTS